MNKIDRDIDLNLQIIYNGNNHSVMTAELKDADRELPRLSIFEARILAEKLVAEKLITRQVERCDITPLGIEVIENGGWVQYKQQQLEEKRKANNLQKQKEELVIDLLEYQKKNRKQEEKISTLTIENLKLQNFQMYSKIGFTFAGFILGFIGYWFIS